jgi:hypothetical protein
LQKSSLQHENESLKQKLSVLSYNEQVLNQKLEAEKQEQLREK